MPRAGTWNDRRLDALQSLLDEGRSPAECARALRKEMGCPVKPSTIREVIRRYGLRHAVEVKPKTVKTITNLLREEATPEPVRLDLDYSQHDEDPGDDKGIYRAIPMAMLMPRMGDY